jgi:hypothetical protein
MREARNEIRWTCMAGGCLLVKSLVGGREEEEKMERMVYKEIWQVMIMETRRDELGKSRSGEQGRTCLC